VYINNIRKGLNNPIRRNKMNSEKMEKYTNEWTAPNGQVRRYVNLKATGLIEVERHKSGTIKKAFWNGNDISNSEAGRILVSKFYFIGEELFQKGDACQNNYVGDLMAFFA
jgi:hypothetical protein